MKAALACLVVVTTASIAACASLGSGQRHVLVAGAAGQTGQQIVRHLQQGGYRVHALVRHFETAMPKIVREVPTVQGHVKHPATLGPAMKGMHAVISSIGARGKEGPDRPEMVDYQGVRNLVDAAKAAKVRQFVLISSRGVTQEGHPLNRMFGNVLVWKLKGEDYLRASGIPYTIIRPGGLLNEPGGKGDIVFEQGDRKLSGALSIPREDVALVCVEALKHTDARNRTFEVYRAADGPPVSDWKAKFAGLKPDGT
jgi:uncharacterized protein YbjT (DUF2867 family)